MPANKRTSILFVIGMLLVLIHLIAREANWNWPQPIHVGLLVIATIISIVVLIDRFR